MAPQRKGTCLTCRRVAVLADKGRCPSCNAEWNRKHERERARTRKQPWYDDDWRRIRRETIEAHVATHGYTCPRLVPTCPGAHPIRNPLTVDHIKPRSLEHGVRVCCRHCNSSLGARHGNAQRRARGV